MKRGIVKFFESGRLLLAGCSRTPLHGPASPRPGKCLAGPLSAH